MNQAVRSLLAGASTMLAMAAAQANTGEIYGFGSRASALGNTMLGGISDGFATFYNPAATSARPGFDFTLGSAFYDPGFEPIQNVTVRNQVTAVSGENTPPLQGAVDTSSYLNHFGQALGFGLNFGPSLANLSLGFAGALPVERLAYMDTGEAFLPEYFNYRSRTQRPHVYFALSATPAEHVHLGAGLAFATNLAATTNVFATGQNSSVTYQRFGSTIKPSVSPYFGLYSDPLPLQAGITIRLPNEYKVSIDTAATLKAIGETAGLDMRLASATAIYYDPLEIDLAVAYRLNPRAWATLEADWYQYAQFKSPSLSITDQGSLIELRNSISNLPAMRNIVVPKLGFQFDAAAATLRAGYSFRPSPVKDNSGPGNLVDPSKHLLTAGIGFDLQKFGVTKAPVQVDLHAQYHHLVHKHVVKSPNNELNNATNGTAVESKIGAPGYDIGGKIFGGGLSLTVSF